MRVTFKKSIVVNNVPTVFDVVSCPANMIGLWVVSAGISG